MARKPRPRIGKEPNRLRLQAIPVLSTMLGSLFPLLPVIATAPIMPQWGFLILLAWRMLHRNIWPAWIILPLGLFDDMFSGQPLGSAMMLWTLAILCMEVLDRRMIWRDFFQEWAIAALMIVVMILAQLYVVNWDGGTTSIVTLLPQIFVSILAFPLVALACSKLDQWRVN